MAACQWRLWRRIRPAAYPALVPVAARGWAGGGVFQVRVKLNVQQRRSLGRCAIGSVLRVSDLARASEHWQGTGR